MERCAHLTQPVGAIFAGCDGNRFAVLIKGYGLESVPCAEDDRDSAAHVGHGKTGKANRGDCLNRQSGEPENQRDIFKTAPEQTGAAVCQNPPDE